MKCLVVLLAVVVLVSAIEDKKPKEEKKEEKKPEERGGLQWPLPDPSSEGDLMLHGSISYDRVEALHKAKVEDEVDRMILDHGRQFLRLVAKFFNDNADLKVLPALCRDSRNLNGTVNRWRIEIPKEPTPPAAPIVQRDEPLPKDAQEDKPKDRLVVEPQRANITNDNETRSNSSDIISNSNSTTLLLNASEPISSNSSSPISNSSESIIQHDAPLVDVEEKPFGSVSNSTERSNATEPARRPEDESHISCEARRAEFYREVGSNFARLLLKQYRKETLKADESAYLARWLSDEAVHYGAVAIYCGEGENVKEIQKRLADLLEQKA